MVRENWEARKAFYREGPEGDGFSWRKQMGPGEQYIESFEWWVLRLIHWLIFLLIDLATLMFSVSIPRNFDLVVPPSPAG